MFLGGQKDYHGIFKVASRVSKFRKTHIWEGEDESGTFPPTLNFAATARYRVLIVTP